MYIFELRCWRVNKSVQCRQVPDEPGDLTTELLLVEHSKLWSHISFSLFFFLVALGGASLRANSDTVLSNWKSDWFAYPCNTTSQTIHRTQFQIWRLSSLYRGKTPSTEAEWFRWNRRIMKQDKLRPISQREPSGPRWELRQSSLERRRPKLQLRVRSCPTTWARSGRRENREGRHTRIP